MARQNKAAPASALDENGRRKLDRAGHQIDLENSTYSDPPQPLIDRHGHRHTEAVLRHWSPAVLKAMGVLRVKPESPEGGVA